MKIGILGTGFGAYHASIYQKSKQIDSIIIYGRDEKKRSKIEKEMNIKTTSQIENIIENPEIDLIDICLPSKLHKKYVIEALKNGKHVFCETPVSLTLQDALEMKEAEQMYGKKLFINLFIKFERPYEIIHEAVQNNTYGKLNAIHLKRKTPPLWGDLGLNHIVTNLMIHELDFVAWLLDHPKNISVVGIQGKNGQSHVDVQLQYKNVLVEIQTSSMMPVSYPFTVSYEVVFEKGTIEFVERCYENQNEINLVEYTNEKKEKVEMDQSNCYEKSIKHVLDCCGKDINSSKISINDAIKSLDLAMIINEKLKK
ncbi:Gfo/Idh/MocA family protein [Chengkuizengella axinellae]|uniref:Gfo/Idh/MocA family oxidoreductase n=1 Tax=Chengkuizengella axinellae TaxID=3064388 RepID=A0ABT9IWD7_9BACL|nr:Gfo/Idh/MocA family oxidoreductase [Chengkuizengella sp. 2205SS18-9]MDP5273648.1 Gfo/Idh/MocA family oxidoreductase [Chengkuizengella sp. 2205SS18-9]